MKSGLRLGLAAWTCVLGNSCLPTAARAAEPVKSACRAQALSRDQEVIFEWARGLRDLKGDGDPRTSASEEYQDEYYALGEALLATGADLYALDADCNSLLNYVAHDRRPYEILLAAGYQLPHANFVSSPLNDALYFWGNQLEWARDSGAFSTHFERLIRDLSRDLPEAEFRILLETARFNGDTELVKDLEQARARRTGPSIRP